MKKEKLTKFSDYVYYYKWHVIIAVVVIVVIAMSVRSCVNKVEDDMTVTVLISNNAHVDARDNIAEDLVNANLIPDFNGDGINSPYINIITVPLETKSEMDMAGNYQAMIAMATDDSSLFLVDEDLLEMYEEQEAFEDISQFAEECRIPEDVLYIDENGIPIGISLKDNEYLEAMGIVTDTLYACFRNTDGADLSTEEIEKIIAAEKILEYIIY